MALIPQDEYKSINYGFQNEEGTEVMHASASYSRKSINMSLDMFSPEYCTGHAEDVQSAIKDFLGRLNAQLTELNLPTIQS